MTSIQTKFNFPEVRVVEASAGSGKTYALSKRYIQLLLNPSQSDNQVPLRNILAITFTNKAALEMKARILMFLKRIALKSLEPWEEEDLLKSIGLNRDDASRRAFLIMETLIHNYNFFQVQTIDSFINALLSGCAYKIGLSANFKIKRNSLEYLRYSLDQMIEQAHTDPDLFKLFSQFLHQYLFLENKPGWFPKEDMLLLLRALYQQRNTYGCEFIPYATQAQDLMNQKKEILKQMRDLKAQMPEGMDARFLKSFNAFLEKYSQGFDFDRLSDYFARENIPAKKGVDVPVAVELLWEKIRQNLQTLSEAEAYSLFNPYVSVFNHLKEIFFKVTQKEDILFLEELNQRARNLFDEGMMTVEELYYRLATRFRHYLVDEFQDTSVLQWGNLFLMIEEALSTGGSLFYVGDKKQAIYGFRGGEVELFDHIKNQFAAFNVQTEQLQTNYRSQKAIVEFNNSVFSLDNLKRFIRDKEDFEEDQKKKDRVIVSDDDFRSFENIFSTAHQKFLSNKDQGHVKIEYVCMKKKEERNAIIREKLLSRIKELKKRFAYRDIAILTRGNQEIEEITSWLMEDGVFVESERTLNIKENPLVQELIVLLQFLNSPIDNLSFSQFIVGDIFSKAVGFESQTGHAFLFKMRQKMLSQKDYYIYKEFRDAYPKIWNDYLDEFFKNIGLYPLYELMISILSRLNVLTHFPDQQGFIMRFLEVIKKQEEDGSDVTTFLENFENMESEELYVDTTDSDSIKILTIHKSKGLEFPVVIIPFLGMNIHVGSGGSFGQQSYMMNFTENSLELLRIKRKYLKYSDKLYAIWREEYLKSLRSELNNIYVALTRAEKELYGFIPSYVGINHNFVQFLIPVESLELGRPVIYEQESVEEQARMSLPVSAYEDWIQFLKDEFLEEDQVLNRAKVIKGEICHALLAGVKNLCLDCLKESLQKSLSEVKVQYPFISEKEFGTYLGLVQDLCEQEKMKPFFFVEEGEVFVETDISNSYGHSRRIDRHIVKESEVWIIDYKSSSEKKEEYIQQVSEYMQLMQDIYPKKKMRGFLIYLDRVDFEEL